jgi:tetratricopeptide (TPR) repeat protein
MAEETTNAHFERGLVLLRSGRYEMAEKEYRLAVAQEPDSAYAHALLANVLRAMKRHNEALAEADEAVHLAPEAGYTHYHRALALDQMDRLKDAEAAAREAIRLDAYDADYRSLLASILNQQGQWACGLVLAKEGLEIDPENIECLHQQSLALRVLGRKDEAHRVLAGALTLDPENARSQAAQGWNCLSRHDYRPALDHFREALRLEPGMESAREGLVEALKARYRIYRWILRYFRWIEHLSFGGRMGLVLCLGFLGRIFYESSPGINLASGLYLMTFLLIFLTTPASNLALRLSRFGRYALSKEETTAAYWFGGFVAGTVALLVVGGILDKEPVQWLGGGCLAMILPLSVGLNRRTDKPCGRRSRGVVLIALGGLGLLAWVLFYTCGMAAAVAPLILFLTSCLVLTARWSGLSLRF